MKSLTEHFRSETNLLWQIHEKVSSWTAHLIGPLVFNIGIKENAWNLSTADLLAYPEASVGKVLGEFLKKNKLEPIAGAESHDLYHVLFGYSTTFKGEIVLQFFLRGNGKNSIASFSTSISAWFIFLGQWHLLKAAYARGKRCADISRLDLKNILKENFEEVKASLMLEENTSSI